MFPMSVENNQKDQKLREWLLEVAQKYELDGFQTGALIGLIERYPEAGNRAFASTTPNLCDTLRILPKALLKHFIASPGPFETEVGRQATGQIFDNYMEKVVFPRSVTSLLDSLQEVLEKSKEAKEEVSGLEMGVLQAIQEQLQNNPK
ncbi:hypothetical protein A3A66_04340 [Microgenomates group bacterium RIFCSPLOWO2_01_FULL_46_13]|nr:MAG: hypothetical protein A2783_04290 [Microgenomates group bacterium RIFCSPHIGHO2_01_FULL_45_11]OGV94205.1 MAG: hypothetical protein A3A66_04340 [Microgenomates group bacterium RIFCSPLOWO2_01_FULL_46_13]